MKIMAKEPYFPFYYRDFMVSTGEMTDAEVGKYLRYLIHQWEKGSIPGDPAMIQTIRFDSNLWETLEPKFPLCDDGRRRNPRLEEIRQERDQYIAKRSAAGKVGAGVRWDSKRNAIANTIKDDKPHGKTIASTSISTSTPTTPANAIEENKSSATRVAAKASKDFIITKRKRKLIGTLLEFFNEFWETFGDKRGKVEAADAWMDIDWPPWVEMSKERYFQDKILPGAEEYAAHRQDLINSGSTPKMAQGWISGRRWEDEILKTTPEDIFDKYDREKKSRDAEPKPQ